MGPAGPYLSQVEWEPCAAELLRPPELVRPGSDPEPDDWPNTTTGRRERVPQGGGSL